LFAPTWIEAGHGAADPVLTFKSKTIMMPADCSIERVGTGICRTSGRVVEDDADCVPHARADTAHTVAEIHPVIALGSLYWPVMDREGHTITLAKRDDLRAALHAWPLFS